MKFILTIATTKPCTGDSQMRPLAASKIQRTGCARKNQNPCSSAQYLSSPWKHGNRGLRYLSADYQKLFPVQESVSSVSLDSTSRHFTSSAKQIKNYLLQQRQRQVDRKKSLSGDGKFPECLVNFSCSFNVCDVD